MRLDARIESSPLGRLTVMSARKKSLIQIAVALPMLASGLLWIGSLVSLSREEAARKAGAAIPENWERVIINHGFVHHWPFQPWLFWPSIVLFLGCTMFLVLFTLGIFWKSRG